VTKLEMDLRIWIGSGGVGSGRLRVCCGVGLVTLVGSHRIWSSQVTGQNVRPGFDSAVETLRVGHSCSCTAAKVGLSIKFGLAILRIGNGK